LLQRMAFHVFPAWRSVAASAPYGAVVLAAIATMLIVPGLRGVIGGGLAILMLSIAIVDARQFIIPDRLVFIAIVLGLVSTGVESRLDAAEMLIAVVRGALMALVFGALRGAYAKLRKREGMGLGDVKLAIVAGVWLDWMTIAAAIEIAALAALVVTGVRIVRGRQITGGTPIPFGLFFAPAIWVAWLIEVNFMGLP
jgi:leader peptidase (prepilin peptidase)/N-methyltransferase